MAETEEQRQQRVLDELKGKNVAHYSVMLAAYINAGVDANKAIFVFSSTGFGLLIVIVDKLQQLSICVKIGYIGALVAFFVAACSTLLVYILNVKLIESHIRSKGEESMEFKLKTWKYINYFSFVIGLVLLLVFAIVGIFNSNKRFEANVANPAVKEVRVHRFIIEDDKGRTRAMLGVFKDGSELQLSDENCNPRVVLIASKDESELQLQANGKMHAWLHASNSGSLLHLHDENGDYRIGLDVFKDSPKLYLCDKTMISSGKPRVKLDTGEDGPMLQLFDTNGRTLWKAP